MSGAMLRSSMMRWPAYSRPAPPKEAIASRNAAAMVRRCGHVRRVECGSAAGGGGGSGTLTMIRGDALPDGDGGGGGEELDDASPDMTQRRYR